MANGPVGRVISKVMPILEAGVYEVAAEMLDLQPDDELLDIGCGPGAFLASNAQRAPGSLAWNPSRTMLREAERRLADRISAGTARLVIGSAAALPFSDGEFTATTAIFAPPNPAETFRVLLWPRLDSVQWNPADDRCWAARIRRESRALATGPRRSVLGRRRALVRRPVRPG
jgi:SAM-dependent methyltransferase